MVLSLTLVYASLELTEPAKILQPHLPELKKAETENFIFLLKVKLPRSFIYRVIKHLCAPDDYDTESFK
jgi:hypothetical protein